MNKNEFIKLAMQSGYANRETAEKYTKKVSKDTYDDHDFIELYHMYTSMRLGNIPSTKGLRQVFGMNGKTTAYNNIAGNSGVHQDWD